jgi:hypothetical protein
MIWISEEPYILWVETGCATTVVWVETYCVSMFVGGVAVVCCLYWGRNRLCVDVCWWCCCCLLFVLG